jgi:hypothetical protein
LGKINPLTITCYRFGVYIGERKFVSGVLFNPSKIPPNHSTGPYKFIKVLFSVAIPFAGLHKEMA